MGSELVFSDNHGQNIEDKSTKLSKIWQFSSRKEKAPGWGLAVSSKLFEDFLEDL